MQQEGITVEVKEIGLLLSKKKPFLGTSLDRVITNLDTNEKWGMEINSPFSKAGVTVEDACKTKKFFLEKLSDGTIRLKRTYDYYIQVQGQLYVAYNLDLKGVVFMCILERNCLYLKRTLSLKVTGGRMKFFPKLIFFTKGLFSLKC